MTKIHHVHKHSSTHRAHGPARRLAVAPPPQTSRRLGNSGPRRLAPRRSPGKPVISRFLPGFAWRGCAPGRPHPAAEPPRLGLGFAAPERPEPPALAVPALP